MQMLGLAKKNGLYLGLLLVAAGCDSSSNNNNDVGTVDGRVSDAAADRAADAGAGDARADAATTMDASGDASAVDGTIASDARDAAPSDALIDTERRDGAADVPILMDGPVVDATSRDAADAVRIDGASLDSGFAVDGGVTTTFIATLTGAQETPPNISTAVGSAIFTLSADRTQLSYHVIHDVTGATGAHIHLAAGGEPGAIIFPLTPIGVDMSGILNLTPADAVNLTQGMFYVNVHSPTFPGGEIRGQILRPGETLWVANLTGTQEVPAVTTTATGHAALILDRSQTSIRYHVTMTGLTPTGAQIQNAIATLSGPVRYQLTPVAAIIDGVQNITATDNGDLADRHWYVNVLTASNPGGELRGQVLQPGETLCTAMLTGSQETPPVTTGATGNAQFVLDPGRTSLRYEAMFEGLSATASHIHIGAAGVAGPIVYPLTLLSPTVAKGNQPVTAENILNLDAGLFFINAHTTANPNGEIRGQITKP